MFCGPDVARNLGKGQPPEPAQPVESVGELVTVELVAELGPEAVAILEPLLGLAARALGDELLDPHTGRTLERDSHYLRDELYENPDHLDAPIVVAASHRMLRILRSALAGDENTVLDDLLAAAPDPMAPQGAIAAADVLADHVDQDRPYEWVAAKLGWYSYVLKDMAASAKEGAGEFAGFSGGAVSMLAALGVDGVVAILVSVYVGLLATAWRAKGGAMDDVDIVRRIDELVEEEHRLERAHGGEPLSDEDQAKVQRIEVALDQCWDLLRQRRARRHAGEDPNEAEVRPPGVVEGYQQ